VSRTIFKRYDAPILGAIFDGILNGYKGPISVPVTTLNVAKMARIVRH